MKIMLDLYHSGKLKMKLNEDNDKKLVVGDWRSIEDSPFGENSYIKLGSPEHVSSEHIYSI